MMATGCPGKIRDGPIKIMDVFKWKMDDFSFLRIKKGCP
jgi:hypothetical protein